MNQDERKLIHERQRLLKKLAGLSLLLHGSYLERFSTCMRSQCECHRGRKHGPRFYLIVYRDKRQRQAYVPQPEHDAVQRGLRQYEQLCEIVRAITDINLQLMRAGCLGASQGQTRKGGSHHE
jgi:hypothetical protein